jgi:hypothetical protein
VLCRKFPLAADPAVKLQTPKNKPTKNQHPLIQPQSNTVMKTIIHSSILLALASSGIAFGAATATTGAVGYETIALTSGFNFMGIRLHENPIAVGLLDSATAAPNTVTDAEIDLAALITGGKTYVLEIQDGSGIIQEITTAGAGTSIVTAANLTGLTFPCSYSLRPASTLDSVFGSTAATCKLSIGGGGAGGADQVWFFTGSGYTKVYFDQFGGPSEVEGWYNFDTGASVPGGTNIIYADGFVISAASAKNLTISGDLKAGPTELNVASGFNFAGSVGPVGMTLDTAYGDTTAEVTAAGLAIGGGGAGGADQLWFYNGSGYTKVYFDQFGGPSEVEGWYNFDTGASVPASTVIPPGYVISAAAAGDIKSGVPSYYTGL